MEASAQEKVLQILSTNFSLNLSLERFQELLKEGLSVKDVVYQILSDDYENFVLSNRMNLFFTLLDHCQENPSILAGITKQKYLKSLRDVALRAFPELDTAAEDLRLYIYATEPTAAIAGLLKSGGIFLLERPSKKIADALESFLEYDFDILRSSVAEACDEWLPEDDETTFQQIKETLCDIQRLAVIVKHPEDIGTLFNAGFTSAHSIAQVVLPSFTMKTGTCGRLIAEPAKIYSHAVSIDLHNEQVITLMSQKFGKADVQSLVPYMAAALPSGSSFGAALEAELEESKDAVSEEGDGNFKQVSIASFSRETVQWTSKLEAKSVPAIAVTKETKPDKKPKKLEDSLKGSTSAATSILMDVNLPDSPDTLSVLSPAAYLVDLLQMLKGVFEEPQIGSDSQPVLVPRNLLTRHLLRRPDIEGLQLSVANQEVHIPYIDLANEIMESIVWYFGNPLAEIVIETHDMTSTNSEELNAREPQNINNAVYSKHICNQIAPLHQFPYNLAIERTRNLMNGFQLSRLDLLGAFCTKGIVLQATGLKTQGVAKIVETLKAAEILSLSLDDFAIITGKDFYGKLSNRTSTAHELWGYSCENDMLDTGKDLGLYFIKKQLLPRAGISFETLVEVVESKIFENDLVIYAHEPNDSDETPKLAPNFESYRICSKGKNKLLVPTCARLNIFLRLLKKLKWSVSELSESLLVLQSNIENSKIAGSVLVDLASLSGISQLTGISRRALLSLWTKSSSSSQLSSLLRLEFELACISGLDKVFSKGLEGSDNSLDWETLGVVHRVVLLCKIMKISIAEYLDFLSESSLGLKQLFVRPADTLQFLKRWRNLLQDDKAENVLRVLKRTSVDTNRIRALNFLESATTYFTSNDLWLDPSKKLGSLAEQSARSRVSKAVSSLLVAAVPDLTTPAISGLPQTVELVANNVCYGINRSTYIKPSDDSVIDGFLFAPVISRCTFEILDTKNADHCELSFNGKKLTLHACVCDGKAILQSDPVELRKGTWQSLQGKVAEGVLNWQVSEKSQTCVTFVPQAIVSTISEQLEGLEISSTIINWMKLDKTEMTHFIPREYGTYLSRLILLEEITLYNELKKRSRGLLEFLLWASQANATEKLSDQLQSLTNLPLKLVEELLNANYPNISDDEKRAAFKSCNVIHELRTQADFMRRTNLLKVSPQLLINSAIGELNGNIYNASEKLWSSFRSSTLSSGSSKMAFKKANELLRTSRRDALIHYLLQQDYIKNAKIEDADGLFEYFLIDVQMGPNQTTTRIMQAISSTQLFIERCLHNLESGISPSRFDKAQWSSWLGSYRKWESNRKIFLYPENWIDPTLRDDKTELFKELEVSMAQKQLDGGTMLQLVKNYIYGVHDLGSLQIESYYQEELKGDEKRFHFFARTKSSPPRYYYRAMTYTTSKNITPQWSPWQVIQVDVPIYEVDELGNALECPGSYLIPFVWKKQLHLLIPQLVLKPGESQASALAMGAAAAPTGKKPQGRYWELKLAWTIYRDGAWTPKTTSLSALKIDVSDEDGRKFPNVSSLVFGVDAKSTGLTIYIERTLSVGTEGNLSTSIISLGKFVMRGDSLVIKPTETPTKEVVSSSTMHPSLFNKLVQDTKIWSLEKAASPWAGASFAIPPYQRANTTWDTKWTLSYSGDQREQAPEGLVVNIESTDMGVSSTWFQIPDEKISVQGSNASVRLYNVLSSNLVEAATNATCLKDVFQTLSVFNSQMKVQQWKDGDKDETKEEIGYSNWEKLSCMKSAYGMHGSSYFKETSTPYAIYNWELGLHTVSLFMERLAATRQYELALEVARLVFDPTIVVEDDENAQWLFHPFKHEYTRNQGKTYTLLSEFPTSTGKAENIPQIILDWRRNAFSPHAIARNRPLAYMKRLAMKYVEILIDAGDAEFRKDTQESMPLALQLYVEASHVFGRAPEKIPQVTKAKPLTYHELSKKLDDFSNASVELELLNPFFVPFKERGRAVAISTSSPGFVKTKYFFIPANPEIAALRARIDDRLFKVRNCLDINGQPRHASMFGSPIDPRVLIQKGAGAGFLDQVVKDVNVSLSKYRFKFLLQKAFDLCSELKSLGSAYLAAKERKDSEQMMITKINQEKFVNDIILQMKTLQREEASKTLEQLQQSRESAAFRLEYFSTLTGDHVQVPGEEQAFDPVRQFIGKRSTGFLRMSDEEETELYKAESAASWTLLAMGMESLASVATLIPPISTQAQPGGMGITISSPPWGQGALVAASIFKGLSMYDTEQGAYASRVNRLLQQLQDRRQQLNQAGLELKTTDQSIKAQRARISAIDKDVEAHKMQMKNALETMEYVKTKSNNLDLYNYLDRQTLMAFSHTYNLAFELSRHARKQFSYETGAPHTPLVAQDFWDDARSGLLCAEKLSMSLRAMDLEYLDKSFHDFEIAKHFSLRQIAPLALLKLRSLGEAKFSLSEMHYDFDFPGHFYRKIKSVSVSILCNIGPYSSLNCVLSLEDSSYRISDIVDPKYESQGESDARFITLTSQSKRIAISSGQQDTGVFQLDFNDEKYMPFEGAGAASKWNLNFPAFDMQQIDFASISDVVVHVHYTSRDGGDRLKTAAQTSVKDFLRKIQALDKDGSFGLIDLKHDYSIEWHRLVTGSFSGETVKLDLRNIKERLPFYTKAHKMSVSNVYVLLKTSSESTETITATVNKTKFASRKTDDFIPSDFYCLSIGDGEEDPKSGVKPVSKGDDLSSWSQNDWILELNCSSGMARQISEGYLVFSYSLAIPQENRSG
ncbi:hypothetical protein G7Y89_g4722 [Cudoniella acicularis]|uniref:Uncharacterized protein n=1 Tax=Cudoniella acicularis TaxID=354080 RepID=A0A8H4W411_9HELO|nr:hypothetical protein G7Y89_g4722 [Cudoniella acicularis]